MAYSRFFLQDSLPTSAQGSVHLSLSDEDLKHASVVLRTTAAEKIVVVGTDSRAHVIELTKVSREGMWGEIVEELFLDTLPYVALVQGVAKGERMELCIRMSVEVGVSLVIPVLTQRSIVHLDAKKASTREERWNRIAKSAAKQSGRMEIPVVKKPRVFSEVLEDLLDFDLVLVAWEESELGSLREIIQSSNLSQESRVAIVVGPEGGLTSEEVSRLQQKGAVLCTLGDTILRTETAGVIASALVLYERGALGMQKGVGG